MIPEIVMATLAQLLLIGLGGILFGFGSLFLVIASRWAWEEFK